MKNFQMYVEFGYEKFDSLTTPLYYLNAIK